eukprot:gb/GECH01003806.1/.p1 GENE.gb/GECH01003806.1/~~gb/GECH01003806.1/.p1  ORF type:complete len:465 (+),score=85.36 gb/GECH01003806.1/:1-1395(+)
MLSYILPVFTALLPSIEKPRRKIPIEERIMWTCVVLLLFLVASQTPVFGIQVRFAGDSSFLRMIMASNKGSLMELGISPIVTSSLVVQLLHAAELFGEVEQRALVGLEKILGLGLTLFEATSYVMAGMYGPVSQLGTLRASGIILQLFIAGVLCILLDELLQHYGLGSGISLFIATNICERVIWKALSPNSITTSDGMQYEGAIINLFHNLASSATPSFASGLRDAFYRPYLPNITSLIATVLIIIVVIFLQGFRLELPINSKQRRNWQGSYPIRLLYTSNMPIILQNAVIMYIYFFSKKLQNWSADSYVANILGRWESFSGHQIPVGGLAYMVTPPQNVNDVMTDPLHAVFYVAFTLTLCAVLSLLWLQVSGNGPEDVAKKFKEQGIYVYDPAKDRTKAVLQRTIPVAAVTGGVIVGALTIFADFVGAIGSGTGLLMAVNIITQYYQTLSKENPSLNKLSLWN